MFGGAKPKKMKKYNKKGQAQSVGMVITLIVGVGISVMILIFVGTLGGQTFNVVEDDITTIGNKTFSESVAILNNTPAYLTYKELHTNMLTIENASNTQLGLGNFTIDYTNGILTLNDAGFNGTVTANYSYGHIDIQTHVRSGITSSFSALEQTGDYLPLIVLAVVISLVLSLILGFTMFGNKGSGSVL